MIRILGCEGIKYVAGTVRNPFNLSDIETDGILVRLVEDCYRTFS